MIELRRDAKAAAVVVVATGLGVGSRATTEDRLRRDQARHVATGLRPTFGVLAHVKNQPRPVAAPADIVAEADVMSIVTGPGPFPIFDLEELRTEPADALSLVRAA